MQILKNYRTKEFVEWISGHICCARDEPIDLEFVQFAYTVKSLF